MRYSHDDDDADNGDDCHHASVTAMTVSNNSNAD
jgi:hypothetical protein